MDNGTMFDIYVLLMFYSSVTVSQLPEKRSSQIEFCLVLII